MAFNYTKVSATALKLIQNFGTTGSIRRYQDTNYNPVTGLDTATNYTTTTATLATVPSASGLTSFDEKFRQSLTTGKNRVFLVAASGLTFNPEIGDCIMFNSKLWEIGNGASGGLMPIDPTGANPVLFICGCMASGRDPAEGKAV